MQNGYFDRTEFDQRRAKVKAAMAKAELDLIVCADPANMDYLSGYKGWSFYVPQCVLIHLEEEHPIWIGRGQDGAAAHLTTDLPEDHILPYPDHYVQSRERHPMNFVADFRPRRRRDPRRPARCPLQRLRSSGQLGAAGQICGRAPLHP